MLLITVSVCTIYYIYQCSSTSSFDRVLQGSWECSHCPLGKPRTTWRRNQELWRQNQTHQWRFATVIQLLSLDTCACWGLSRKIWSGAKIGPGGQKLAA